MNPYPQHPQDVIDAWNETCAPAGFARARMTDKRRKHIQARLKEREFCECWRELFEKAAASDFLRGRTGWKADFGWIVKNDDNYVKVMEGNYDNRRPTARDTGAVSGPSRYDAPAGEAVDQRIDL